MAMALESVHAVLEQRGTRRKPRRERRDQLRHSVPECHEETPARSARAFLRRLPGRPPEPQHDGPLAPLELAEARHRRREGKVVGIGRVDAGDQRLGDPLERLAAEPPAHEGAQALVVGHAPRQDEVEAHAELSRPGEQSRPDERTELRRRQELKSDRQRMQTPGAPHEHLPEAIVGPDQPVLDAEPLAERQRPRLVRQERIGARLDQEPAAPLGRDGAAEPLACLEQRQLQRDRSLASELDRAVGRREPGDPTADDGELQSSHVTAGRSPREPGPPASR